MWYLCFFKNSRYLLARGAFPSPMNNDGKSPLDLLDEAEEGEEGEENTRQTIRNMLQDAINVQGNNEWWYADQWGLTALVLIPPKPPHYTHMHMYTPKHMHTYTYNAHT